MTRITTPQKAGIPFLETPIAQLSLARSQTVPVRPPPFIDESEIGVKWPTPTLGPGTVRTVWKDPNWKGPKSKQPISSQNHSNTRAEPSYESIPLKPLSDTGRISDRFYQDPALRRKNAVEDIVDDYGDDLRAVIPPSPSPYRLPADVDLDVLDKEFAELEDLNHGEYGENIEERDITEEHMLQTPPSIKGWTEHGEEYEVPIYPSPDGDFPLPLRAITRCGIGPRHIPIKPPTSQAKPAPPPEQWDFDTMQWSPGSSVHEEEEEEAEEATEELAPLSKTEKSPRKLGEPNLPPGQLDAYRALTMNERISEPESLEGPVHGVPRLRQYDNYFGQHEFEDSQEPVHSYSPLVRMEQPPQGDESSAPQGPFHGVPRLRQYDNYFGQPESGDVQKPVHFHSPLVRMEQPPQGDESSAPQGPFHGVPRLRQYDNYFGQPESGDVQKPVHFHSPLVRMEQPPQRDESSAPQASVNGFCSLTRYENNPGRPGNHRTKKVGKPFVFEPPKPGHEDWTSIVGGLICIGSYSVLMSTDDLCRGVKLIVDSNVREKAELASQPSSADRSAPMNSLSESSTSYNGMEHILGQPRKDVPVRPTRNDLLAARSRAPTPPGLYGKRALNSNAAQTQLMENRSHSAHPRYNQSWILHYDSATANLALIPEGQINLRSKSFGMSVPTEALKRWLDKQYQYPTSLMFCHEHPFLTSSVSLSAQNSPGRHSQADSPLNKQGGRSRSGYPSQALASASARASAKAYERRSKKKIRMVDLPHKRLTTVSEAPSEAHSSAYYDNSSGMVTEHIQKSATTSSPRGNGARGVPGSLTDTNRPSPNPSSRPAGSYSLSQRSPALAFDRRENFEVKGDLGVASPSYLRYGAQLDYHHLKPSSSLHQETLSKSHRQQIAQQAILLRNSYVNSDFGTFQHTPSSNMSLQALKRRNLERGYERLEDLPSTDTFEMDMIYDNDTDESVNLEPMTSGRSTSKSSSKKPTVPMYPLPAPSENLTVDFIRALQSIQPYDVSAMAALEPSGMELYGVADPFRSAAFLPNLVNSRGYASVPYHYRNTATQQGGLTPSGNQQDHSLQSSASSATSTPATATSAALDSPAVRRRKKFVAIFFATICAFTPFTSAAYFFGYFDRIMSWFAGGNIIEYREHYRRIHRVTGLASALALFMMSGFILASRYTAPASSEDPSS